MSVSHLDKSPDRLHSSKQRSFRANTSPYSNYPVRRMRNTAVLVKWIEEHQSNPYPTKAEKQYLAYYSGMNLTQLSTWFANARRRIKKIGMKTWLEGRSTFTVDFFPSASSLQPSRDYGGSSYSSGLNPYAAATMQYSSLTNYPSQQHSPSLNLSSSQHRLQANSYNADVPSHQVPGAVSSSSVNYGLYASTSRSSFTQPLIGMSAFTNWSAPSLLPNTTSPISSLHSRPSSNSGPTLHSPLTAQVYSTDPVLRTQASLDIGESGPYSLPQQHSPDQMIPECASTEPLLQGSSPKSHYSRQTD